MRFPLLLLFFSLCCSSVLLYGQNNFSSYFTDGAIRYDFELAGNADTVFAYKVQSKKLPSWGGNPAVLIESLDYGTCRYSVFSAFNSELIFRKGFSPLFWEWQSTAEARHRMRSFYHALYFPVPLNDVIIRIDTRKADNQWMEIFSDTLKQDDYFIIDEEMRSAAIDTLLHSGTAAQKIDLMILAEGYRADEMEKFRTDAQRMTEYLFNSEPFGKYRQRFNVYAMNTVSLESGTDIPGERIYRNTAFNSHFYTFDSPRYLTTTDMKPVYDALDGVGWDHIYILVNHERYGGGGFYNFFSLCSSDNERSPFVFCHEFGHSFAGLGDEYYTSATSYESFYQLTAEPWEPNLTTLIDFESKWKEMLSNDTPVPTPREERYKQGVGVFEGGGYVARGIYSPVMSCWMKEHTAGAFCPVCQKAIERVILLQSE
jgi:hypothetical protein